MPSAPPHQLWPLKNSSSIKFLLLIKFAQCGTLTSAMRQDSQANWPRSDTSISKRPQELRQDVSFHLDPGSTSCRLEKQEAGPPTEQLLSFLIPSPAVPTQPSPTSSPSYFLMAPWERHEKQTPFPDSASRALYRGSGQPLTWGT